MTPAPHFVTDWWRRRRRRRFFDAVRHRVICEAGGDTTEMGLSRFRRRSLDALHFLQWNMCTDDSDPDAPAARFGRSVIKRVDWDTLSRGWSDHAFLRRFRIDRCV